MNGEIMGKYLTNIGNEPTIHDKVMEMRKYLTDVVRNIPSVKKSKIEGYFEQFMPYAERLLHRTPSYTEKKDVLSKFRGLKSSAFMEGIPRTDLDPNYLKAIEMMEEFLYDLGLIEYYSKEESTKRLHEFEERINRIPLETPPENGNFSAMEQKYGAMNKESLRRLDGELTIIEYELEIILHSLKKRGKCAEKRITVRGTREYECVIDCNEHGLYIKAKNLFGVVHSHGLTISSTLSKNFPFNDWENVEKYL